MMKMQKFKSLMLAAALIGLSSVTSYAATPKLINIRFGGGNADPSFKGAGAIGMTGDFWNIAPALHPDGGIGTVADLNLLWADGTGSSSVLFSYISDAVVSAGYANTGFIADAENKELMSNYVYTAPGSPYDTITITNLNKNLDYNLYALSQTETTVGNAGGNGQWLELSVLGNSTYSIKQTAASNGTSGTFIPGQNVISGLVRPDASGNLTITYLSQVPGATAPVNRASLNALQLSPTPEPASMLLLGIGGALLSARKLRKKKAAESLVS